MKYIFIILILLNICLFGYYVFVDDGVDNTSAMREKSFLTKEVAFKNSSADIPPVIGTAK